jgi:hypothetical protein
MFETTTILASLAAERLGRWGRIIAVSAILLWPLLTPMAYADVDVSTLKSFLGGGGVPPKLSDPTHVSSRNVAVKHVLQRLVRRPDGSFDTLYATRLGFDLPPDNVEAAVQQASLSSPIAVFRIGLKRLKQFNPGQDDVLLLAADANWLVNLPSSFSTHPVPARFLFPITVKDPTTGADVVESSVRLQYSFSPANPPPPQLGFEIERFGSSTLIRQIDKWRRKPNPPNEIDFTYFLVWVPALDRYYLGKLKNDKLLILVDLNGGNENFAKNVFLKLKAEALEIIADDPDAPPR